MNSAADDPDGQTRLTGFLQGLQEFRMDRRPQRSDRVSLGSRRARTSQIRGGISRSLPRRNYGFDQRERIGFAADRQHCAHRICIGH